VIINTDADRRIHAIMRDAVDKFTTDMRASLDAASAALKELQEPVTICAWCPEVRERTLALTRRGRVVSHGICPACAEKFKEDE
jgi:hypothetical protein